MLIRDDDGSHRELLGHLLTTNSIRKKDATEITFDPGRVISWRVVPDQPRRRPTSLRIREIELASDATWPAVEVVDLGGWRLRASGGFTQRANSVLPVGAPPYGEPTGDLEAALKTVVDFYRSRELIPRFQIPLPSYGPLDAVLEEQGWESTLSVSVQICDLAVLASAPEHQVTISALDDEWLAIFPPPLGQDGLAVLTGGGAFFATIHQLDPGSGQQVVAAIGRGAVFGDWCGITAINTSSQFQQRGLATSIIRALAQHAFSLGADRTFLQVSPNNSPALALYRKLGFTEHHTYSYRSLP
ncbi:acetyltransferase (GNAT) family protein [mine drainage metagenome]|uniref:Acetyltransferase (GNAT) family protein n=1 Tax=mine drainage metagenome TaxID=410659 RepID=A0A1J5Q3Y1_9ZZZZ